MIILASKSQSRKTMLDAAGVPYVAEASRVDERAMEAGLANAPPAEVALALARAKALALGPREHLVLGSDSLVVVEGRRFDKPTDRDEAAAHLRFFSGKVMELHSAAALVRGGEVVWDHAALARLHVRDLSEGFIAVYLAAEWPHVGHCVGVFRIEAMGVHLFDRIEGDHFTVLGMPLLPVLGALRDLGELPA
jgi:septum formation protein